MRSRANSSPDASPSQCERRARSPSLSSPEVEKDNVRQFVSWYMARVGKEKGTEEGEKGTGRFAAFDERLHPFDLSLYPNALSETALEWEEWIVTILAAMKIPQDELFDTAVYIERAAFAPTSHTAHRTFLACLILASKQVEDRAVWLDDFDDFDNLADTKRAETALLSLLAFDARVMIEDHWRVRLEIMDVALHPDFCG